MGNIEPSSRVLIVGGGVCGLALAVALKKAGIASEVYEATQYKEGAGGGFNIAPNGMKVLATLGVAAKLIPQGTIVKDHWFRNGRGKIVGHMRNGRPGAYGQPGLTLSRASLTETLSGELRDLDVPLYYGKKLKDITDEGLRVTAHFEDGTEAVGSILIGADGIRSRTRELIFPDGPRPEFSGFHGVGGLVPLSKFSMPASTQQSLNYTFGQAGFFGYTGIGKEHMMWWASLPAQAPLSREELRDTTTLKEDMLRQFEGYHAPVEDLIWNTEKSLKVNMEDIASLATWHRGKVLLLGDAAHVVNSSSGQGASLALEDALYLARLIRDSENTYHSVFEQFERERKPRVERIIMEGRRKTARKKPVKGVRVKIGEWMMGLFVGLFGEKSLDKNYRYTVDF